MILLPILLLYFMQFCSHKNKRNGSVLESIQSRNTMSEWLETGQNNNGGAPPLNDLNNPNVEYLNCDDSKSDKLLRQSDHTYKQYSPLLTSKTSPISPILTHNNFNSNTNNYE